MKRRLIVVALAVAALLAVGGGAALAWGPGDPGGPWCGDGYGPMMGGRWWGPANPQSQPISFDQAIKAVNDYVAGFNNQDLVVDEVMEFEYNYYAIVNEKSTGIGAFELLVDKYSGRVFPEMGPNMMWNTKYGHMGSWRGRAGGYGRMGGVMGGMMGGWRSATPGDQSQYGFGCGGAWGATPADPSAPMTITPEKATELAKQFLAQRLPGTTTEEPHKFYGYYTLHTLKDGNVTGMLSVNGYTGQVWYHSWHGQFVQERELS